MTDFFIQTERYEDKNAIVVYSVEKKEKLAILTYDSDKELARKLRMAAEIVRHAKAIAGNRPIQEGVKFLCDKFRNDEEKAKLREKKHAEAVKRREEARRTVNEAIDRCLPKFERRSYVRDFKPTTLEEVAEMYAVNNTREVDPKVEKVNDVPCDCALKGNATCHTTLEEVAKFYADQKRNERPHICGTGFIIIL